MTRRTISGLGLLLTVLAAVGSVSPFEADERRFGFNVQRVLPF
ncbi:MAG: hypothetical protein OXU39_02405 [Gemmatimonadota bacterium]|nr:hypothetical protein [Gemmatimonadota bacterium]